MTGHRIETYPKSSGVYDHAAFCWPTPPGQNFAKTLTTAPQPSALCLPSSAAVATPNRCTGECSHVPDKYRHCVIGPGHRVSAAVLRPCLQPHGFIIFRGYVPSAMATAAHTDTCRYVDWVIDQFDEPHGGSSQRDAWSRLNTIPGHWWQDNKHTSWKKCGWHFQRTGYQRDIGGGVIFQLADFTHSPSIGGVQEYFRNLVADWHGLPTWELWRNLVGATLKPPGAPPLPPHRDTKRKTTLQIVVSCSTTEFSFWPQTHHYRSELPLDEKGYISKAGVAQLRKAGYEEVRFCAKPGDSLIFLGGELIHGSPEVLATCLEPRVCVYPEFWPHASSVAIAGMKKRKGCPCSCSCTFERKKPCWRT